ncbi:MAG: thiamine pyrophosphate-requiring protein [Gemmatimonadaceae bacterium]
MEVSDFLLDRLSEWGINRIYGYPGDGINGVMGALRRAGDRFDFVQVAHEELAGFMACAHAKFTGEIGVCMVTSGPGGIHALNGLYDAKMDHQPVLAIVGQQPTVGLGADTQQEVNLRVLMSAVAEYTEVVSSPEQLRHVVDRAIRISLAERVVSCIILPHDVQRKPAVPNPPHKHARQHSGVGYAAPRVLPQDGELLRAADALNQGKKVAILVGAGALGATKEVLEVAELLGAGVAKALLGKAAVPDDVPFVTGSVGWLGTAASNRMLKECDTLFVIGSMFPYTEFLPEEGQARGVQIDIAPKDLSLRYPMDVALAGDSAETLRALIPLLTRKEDRSWRGKIEQNVTDWWHEVDRRAHAPAQPLNPQLPVWELSRQLPDRCILTGDAGSSAVWLGRDIRIRSGMMMSLSGGLGSMGSGVPYALAAKIDYPDRVVIALVGDGAMQMSGINSLIDVSKYWRTWSDPRLIVLVFNNQDLNYVTWEQRVMEGDPKYEKSQDLPDFHFADYAKILGLNGIRIDRAEQVVGAWEQALRADRPTVIDAVVSADVPALPPMLTNEQQQHLRAALAKGDPDAQSVEQQLAAQGVTGWSK